MPRKNIILSRYSEAAVKLLASHIKAVRIQKRMTAEELATRLGVSRSLVHRMESGDPACSIGTVFEAAAILGIPLFHSDLDDLQKQNRLMDEKLALIPARARALKEVIDNDF